MATEKKTYPFVPLGQIADFDDKEMADRATSFYDELKRRRTVRDFSDKPIPREVIDNCILAAGTAPNGANLHQRHIAVTCGADVKSKILSLIHI